VLIMRSYRTLFPLALICLLACSRASRSDDARLRTVGMGDRVELGHIIYTVFDTQWLTQIGQGVDAKIPQNRYFLVRLSAANSSNQKVMVPPTTIVDDDGKTYEELSNGEGVPQWIGLLREARPAEAVQGNVVFDAPPRHYKLRITDEDEQSAALVDIPLTLGTDLPAPPAADTGRK